MSPFNESPQHSDSRHRSVPADEDVPVFISSALITGDNNSAVSLQDAQCIPTLPSHLLDVIQIPPLAVKMEEEEELSVGKWIVIMTSLMISVTLLVSNLGSELPRGGRQKSQGVPKALSSVKLSRVIDLNS